MTPKVWRKVAEKIEPKEKKLAKLGLFFILIFIVFCTINALAFDELIAVTLLPLGVLFILFALALVTYWFKKYPDQSNQDFVLYWASTGIINKLYLYFASVFISFYIFMCFVILIFSIFHTVMYVLTN